MGNSKDVKLVRYTTLRECMCEFYGCFDADLESQPNIKWEGREWTVKEVIEEREKTGTWGFCKDKSEIHFWINDKVAKGEAVIRLFAHEAGHIKHPHYKTFNREEAKAENYANVAVEAFKFMLQIKGIRGYDK